MHPRSPSLRSTMRHRRFEPRRSRTARARAVSVKRQLSSTCCVAGKPPLHSLDKTLSLRSIAMGRSSIAVNPSLRSVTLMLACFCAAASGFLLDGSANSYAQFRKWGGGANGSLEFEFKTDQPNGLLLYTDDGGTYDFFEIKLVEGALRLRYNLGGGAQIITVGRDLNDGHWHKMRTSRGKEFRFGRFATNSDVFVGGMPSWYNTKLTLLALPSVIFEPRFVGAVRNLIYPDTEGGTPRRQETRPKDHRVSQNTC
nr:unnamed protein product [Callosobruchus analis]